MRHMYQEAPEGPPVHYHSLHMTTLLKFGGLGNHQELLTTRLRKQVLRQTLNTQGIIDVT